MEYLLWNDRIAAYFFNPEVCGRRVYLHVTNDLIQEIGKSEDVSVSDFVRSVKLSPPWSTGQPLCLKAEEALAGWRRRKRQFPPYIGFLSLFVLAAAVGEQGEFAAQAYYPRLRKLLGEDQDGKPYPNFSEMRALWRDLEVWSQRDMNGALGVFDFPSTGRLVHVGVPISQVILTADERRNLPFIFVEAALDAGASPPDSYLASVLAEFGPQLLRSRTVRILDDPANHREEREALIEAVLEELRVWDGKVTQITESGAKRTSIHGALRLCCEDLDLVANRVSLRLRCRIRQEFPEDNLLLSPLGESIRYKCQEYSGGWSTVLEQSETGRPLDPSDFGIFEDLAIREATRGWRFKMPRTDVRVLVSGAVEGLPGHVEIQHLPTDSPFFIVASAPAWHLIERWGQSSCQGFKHLQQLKGLPTGSRFYSVHQAMNDDIVRSVYPSLSFPSSERIRLEGGIRLSGNTYFGFALPRIVVEASSSHFQVFCNTKELSKSRDGNFALPSRVPDGTTLEIEVRSGNKPLASRSIFVYSRFPWQNLSTSAWFDIFGLRTQATHGVPRAAGATLQGVSHPCFECWISSTPEFVEEPVWEPPEPLLKPGEESALPNLPTPLATDELGSLVHQWRDELESAEVFTSPSSQLASRSGGDRLTEGAVHYRAGVTNNEPRSLNRAIRIFTDLVEGTCDPVVQVVARALQQLAFYRSGRVYKASSVNLSSFPAGFSRLESAMRGLAEICGAANEVSTWPDGVSFSDLSPAKADCLLEEEMRTKILSKCATV